MKLLLVIAAALSCAREGKGKTLLLKSLLPKSNHAPAFAALSSYSKRQAECPSGQSGQSDFVEDENGTPWVSSRRFQESVNRHARQHGRNDGRNNYLREVNQVWHTLDEHLESGEWQGGGSLHAEVGRGIATITRVADNGDNWRFLVSYEDGRENRSITIDRETRAVVHYSKISNIEVLASNPRCQTVTTTTQRNPSSLCRYAYRTAAFCDGYGFK